MYMYLLYRYYCTIYKDEQEVRQRLHLTLKLVDDQLTPLCSECLTACTHSLNPQLLQKIGPNYAACLVSENEQKEKRRQGGKNKKKLSLSSSHQHHHHRRRSSNPALDGGGGSTPASLCSGDSSAGGSTPVSVCSEPPATLHSRQTPPPIRKADANNNSREDRDDDDEEDEDLDENICKRRRHFLSQLSLDPSRFYQRSPE